MKLRIPPFDDIILRWKFRCGGAITTLGDGILSIGTDPEADDIFKYGHAISDFSA